MLSSVRTFVSVKRTVGLFQTASAARGTYFVFTVYSRNSLVLFGSHIVTGAPLCSRREPLGGCLPSSLLVPAVVPVPALAPLLRCTCYAERAGDEQLREQPGTAGRDTPTASRLCLAPPTVQGGATAYDSCAAALRASCHAPLSTGPRNCISLSV